MATQSIKPKIIFLNIHSGVISRGMEVFIEEAGRRLVDKYEVIVFQGGKAAKKMAYKIITIPYGKFPHQSLLANLVFSFKAMPQLIKERPALIQPCNGRFEALFCRLISFLIKAKLVIAGQSGIGRGDLFNLFVWPDTFICVSSKGKAWAEKWAPHVKKTLILNGADCDKFKPGLQSLDLGLKPPIVIVVSGPEHFKRVDLTIKAVAKLKEVSLLIIGQQREEIMKLAKKLLPKKSFRMIAKVEHEELPRIYNSVQVFSLVSESREAGPISYFEAMACNLPVVARNDSLRREAVGEAGILINPEDIDEYAQALDQALKKNWGLIPRKRAEKFSWEKVVQKYDQVYQGLIK